MSEARDAYRAAWQVIMSGGTLEAGLEAAEPHFRAAERERIRDGLAAITVTLTRPALGYRLSEAHRTVPLTELLTLIGDAP